MLENEYSFFYSHNPDNVQRLTIYYNDKVVGINSNDFPDLLRVYAKLSVSANLQADLAELYQIIAEEKREGDNPNARVLYDIERCRFSVAKCAKILKALVVCGGYFLGSISCGEPPLSFDARIELPLCNKELFEQLAEVKLLQPEKVVGA